MTRRIALRHDRSPAYLNAAPRLRQSQIEKPFMPQLMDQPGWLRRVLGRKV